VKILVEIESDGTRRVGNGPSYILFLPNGDVGLLLCQERPELRASRKNYSSRVTIEDAQLSMTISDSPEVIVPSVTLTVEDFAHVPRGVPSYAESLAAVVNAIVFSLNDDQGDRVLNELVSVIRAARMVARTKDAGAGSVHLGFRVALIILAKKLGRAPTRREIQKQIFEDTQNDHPLPKRVQFQKDRARMVTAWCDANGFGWIERGKAGCPRKLAE
jgi:hypothetical protein